MPIPHTNNLVDGSEKKLKSKKEKILCWWPGVFRAGKGIDKIKLLHQKIISADKEGLKVHLSENAENIFMNNFKSLIFTSPMLSRDEYNNLMNKVDIILLPYDSKHYKMSSSGIFIEAIFAGKIVLAIKNTWMAYELKKHNLEELILDWSRSDIVDYIKKIKHDENIQKKLDKMIFNYRSFHNLEK